MSETKETKPLPEITPVTRHFWEGTMKNRLMMQRCDTCGAYVWTPRSFCFECGSRDLTWSRLSGYGQVYSFTVIRQTIGVNALAFADDVPYIVAWVDLEEGPRMVTNLIGCTIEQARIGMPVAVTFERVSDEIALPKFRPARRRAASKATEKDVQATPRAGRTA